MERYAQTLPDRYPLKDTGLDGFEKKLVPPFRHLMVALRGTRPDAWHTAYATAAEIWGPPVGLPLVHRFSATVFNLHETGKRAFILHDPLDLRNREDLSRDEMDFFEMIHYMRRSSPHAARESIFALTEGRMDAGFIHEAMSFCHDYAVGVRPGVGSKPKLRVVSS
ncbi:MAG: hypothetical protein AAGF94_02910 [Pseudomonadota bacterium]